MNKSMRLGYWLCVFVLGWLFLFQVRTCDAADIRGPWVGSASGTIFGAKGSVNIVDLTCMTQYLFGQAGGASCSLVYCDWDGSGTMNIVDLLGLVGYLFGG